MRRGLLVLAVVVVAALSAVAGAAAVGLFGVSTQAEASAGAPVAADGAGSVDSPRGVSASDVAAPGPRTPSAKPSASPAAPKPTAPKAAPLPARCRGAGPGHRVTEEYLAAHSQFGAVTVDGKQSAADCAAIDAFQKRFGINGGKGYAGPTTAKVAQRLQRAALGRCRTGPGTTICVDLTSQTFWVVRSGATVLGPAPIRTGRAGLATPEGVWRIGNKKRTTISTFFKVRLPYWQQFNGGMGFHETPSYLYEGDSPGSHGCINLLRRDAAALFDLTTVGTPVHVFGRKMGT